MQRSQANVAAAVVPQILVAVAVAPRVLHAAPVALQVVGLEKGGVALVRLAVGLLKQLATRDLIPAVLGRGKGHDDAQSDHIDNGDILPVANLPAHASLKVVFKPLQSRNRVRVSLHSTKLKERSTVNQSTP